MALADNATVKVDLSWDVDNINDISNEFDIDMEEWGVIPETIINPDDFFESIGGDTDGNKGDKIIVEIPSDMMDVKNDIRTNIEEAVRGFNGVKVK